MFSDNDIPGRKGSRLVNIGEFFREVARLWGKQIGATCQTSHFLKQPIIDSISEPDRVINDRFGR